jgi:rRNA small subunit pseudouridine methyltransferase Nep1
LVLAESALQLVPHEIQDHPQIKQYAKRRQKSPNEVLLDRAFHHSAMQRLSRIHYKIPPEKMGRPDIVHSVLLQVLETPLNWERCLQTFVHTQDDYVISIDPAVRLPKNYIRFTGLIEQLFVEKQVPKNEHPLLTMKKMTLAQLARRMQPSKILALTTLGKPILLRDVADYANRVGNSIVLVGGFPRGHFTETTKRLADEMLSVDPKSLDACIVAGRLVYDFEWSIGLAKNRFKQTS